MPSLRIGQLLTLGIFCCSSLTVGNAYLQKGQFYPSVVYLTNSSPSMAVIYAQAAVIVWLMAQAMGKIFFGQLRPAEVEHLFERAWYAVTETCLAFTIFRDDFSPKFVALFVLLLVLKGFHWLSEERVDFMERSPNISLLFHARVLSLLTLLSLLDYAFVRHAYHSVSINGATVQMVFGFEYAILLSTVLYIFIKYVLHSIDSRAETQWENKAVFLLYTELMMSASKVMLYATFMLVMLRIHQFPLFAIRPMYLSVRALKRAFKDVVLSRQAIHNMNTLYPDASEEELVSADNVCIICREEMTGSGNKKLPCNHIFHAACLRSWFQRQQTCPTCRSDVLNVGRSNRRAGNGAQRPPEPANNPVPPGGNPNVNPFAIPMHNLHQYLPQAFFAAHGMFNPLQQQQQQQQQQQDRQQGMPQQQAQQAQNIHIHHAHHHHQHLGQQQQPQQPPGGDNNGANQGGAPGDRPGDPTLNQGGANDGAAPGSGARRGGPRVAPTRPPPPPFFLMPPVFVPPPPPIIPAGINFSALSEEELRAMEGTDRSAVEARIENLRTIQILLDAAVVMMGQNNAMWRASQQATAQSANVQGPSPHPPSSSSSPPESSTTTAAGAAPTAGATGATPTVAAAKNVANGAAASAANADQKSGDVGDEAFEAKPSSSSVTSSLSAAELEAREIRRRRLEKLAGERAQE